MAVIIFRCSGCNRLIQLRENQRGVTTVGLCTVTEGCQGELLQTDRIEDATTPLIAENIPDVVNRQERNVLFNHVQSILSNVWTVTHNLGTNPVVQVAVDRPGQEERVEIEPQLIEIVDANTTRITFDRNESGLAQFISRSSVTPGAAATTTAEVTRTQLTTTAGTLTVATLAQAADVEIIYVDDQGNTTPIIYPITYAPPVLDSPWSNTTTVVVNGVEYDVGSIDTSSMVFPDPSSFYFGTNGVAQPSDMFILLALAPFSDVDKIKRKVVFPEGIGAAEAANSFNVLSGQHFVVDTVIEDVYPPVFVV